MALFTILEPPDGRPEKVAVVPEGFSIRAAVFTIFWALWHRMWIIAVLLFVLSVSLELAARAFRLDPAIVTVSGLAVSLLFGFEARALQILSLKRAGYNVEGMISAESRESAELQYFSRRPAQTAQELPPLASSLPAMSQHHDALGLFGSH
jgi:hypothetical protein